MEVVKFPSILQFMFIFYFILFYFIFLTKYVICNMVLIDKYCSDVTWCVTFVFFVIWVMICNNVKISI